MSERRWPRGARAFGALTLAFLLADVALLVAAAGLSTSDRIFDSVALISALVYGAMGLVVIVRAGNRIGWILLANSLLIQLGMLGQLYPFVGLRSHPGSLPGPAVVGSLLQGSFTNFTIGIALMLLVFPSGKVPSPRWRPVVWGLIAGALLTSVGIALVAPRIHPAQNLRFANPLVLTSGYGPVSTALTTAGFATLFLGISCIWALVARFRHGIGELRQQVKWLAAAVGGGIAFFLVAAGSLISCHCDNAPLATVGFTGFGLFLIIGIPSSIAIAVLKYRLYDIDLIIRKTVLYGLLAAFFTAVYIAIVLGIGAVLGSWGNSLLTVAAAVVIAVAFQPARDRARRLADRIVYGARATPYEVLAEFSDRVATAYSDEDVLPRMAEILARGTGASASHVWLRFGHELRETASWPSNGRLPPLPIHDDRPVGFPSGEHGVEVRHQGELLGALSVETPASDPMNPAKAKLVRDLASQAGLVLRNVRLIEELRASRRRIVTAQDERAKALERNIHDGAQQQLVALGVQLSLAQRAAAKESPAVAELLDTLREQATDALENLRDLARGIYPPLLADKGLAAALDSQVRKSAVPTTLEAESIARYPQDVEAAVYFCVLEALNNVAKYAGATRASVRVSAADGELTFRVEDDGAGFRTDETGFGTGLQGMSDRLEAVGGTLDVGSEPGRGTTVTGVIRVREPGPVRSPDDPGASSSAV